MVCHATAMGVSACWMGPGADQASVVRHLGPRFNAATDHVICICAVGYASFFKPTIIRIMELAQHRRLPLHKLFYADALVTRPLDLTQAPFQRFGRCFEVCQWAPSSFNAQPTRCVGVAEPLTGLVRVNFYAANASRFYSPVALGIWLHNSEAGCSAVGAQGRFEVLSAEQRGAKHTPPLPKYCISWRGTAPPAGVGIDCKTVSDKTE